MSAPPWVQGLGSVLPTARESSQSCNLSAITMMKGPAPRTFTSNSVIFDPGSHLLTLPVSTWHVGTKVLCVLGLPSF